MKKFWLILKIAFLFSTSLKAQIPNTISPEDKVFGLSKFWQEVNYNFVYLDKIDRTVWNNRYKELISTVQNTKNDYEYYRELQKFCALLKDGHTNVYFPDYLEEYISINEFGDYQLFLSNIDDKAVITRINASKKNEIPIGTEIIMVNGMNTDEYMKTFVMPYISSSTEHILKDWATMYLLESPWGTKFELTLRSPTKKITTLNITSAKTSEDNYFPHFKNGELLEFKWLENKTAYVAINSFNNEKLKDLFTEIIPKLEKAKSLIIDLRLNGGGNSNNALNIIDFITNDSIIKLSKWSTRQNISAYRAWGENLTENDTINSPWATKSYLTFNDKLFFEAPVNVHLVNRNVPKIIIPTAVLIGHNTASAAEDFLIYVHNQKHIVKVGEPTFGSTGMPMTIQLPNSGEARICTKKDTYPNGDEFVGIGIQPDIFVRRNLDDFLKDNDIVLKRALEHLNQNK